MKLILAIFLILALLLILSITSCTPIKQTWAAQKQVRVIEVKRVSRSQVDITGLDFKRDTVWIKYGGRSVSIRKGMWLTVRYNGDSCDKGWVLAQIILNK